MDQKSKFILIGLGGVLAIFVFLFISTGNSKQIVIRERNQLKNENASLLNKIGKLENSLREYENKINTLNSDLDKLSQDKRDLENRYELANKVKDELAGKLKELEEKSQARTPEEMSQTADAYWGAILKAKTELEVQLETARSELRTAKIDNERLQREKGTLELELSNLKREKEDLERRAEYNQKVSDSISQGLVRERNERVKVEETLRSLKSENASLMQQVRNLNVKKTNLEQSLQQVQEERTSLERKLNEIEVSLTGKMDQMGELKEKLDALKGEDTTSSSRPKERSGSVELPPIVVRPQNEAPDVENIMNPEGQVLAVNRENNFVIIDLGEESGIKVGSVLTAQREGKPVADLEVIQVRRDISACDIRSEFSPVKVGDTVK